MTSAKVPTKCEGRGWTMHLGDCLEIMPTLDRVDHVITDPPYEKEAHTKARRSHRGPPGDKGGFVSFPIDFVPLRDDERSAAGEAFARLCNRWALVFCQMEGVPRWRAACEPHGLRHIRSYVWVKPDGAPQFTGDRPGTGYECFEVLHAKGASRWNGGGTRGVFTHNCNSQLRKPDEDHQTPKPVALMVVSGCGPRRTARRSRPRARVNCRSSAGDAHDLSGRMFRTERTAMTTAIPQHSAETPEHYTPPKFLVAARKVMGAIDLDPASTHVVNDAHVGAAAIFTKADDGLSRAWRGSVWLNPPGGKLRQDDGGCWYAIGAKDGPGDSSAAIWWKKLAEEYGSGRVTQAIFLAFTLEILRSTQQYAGTVWPGDVPFCVPDERIKFWREVDGKFVVGSSPTHANLIAFLPPVNGHRDEAVASFAREFSQFGKVRT